MKRRRYYPPDIKRIMYAMFLERSAPGMMKEGVTKSVANDMGVPLRVVQRVWRDGKTGGGIISAFDSNKKKIVGVKNFHLTQMSSKMCHLGQSQWAFHRSFMHI
jgi:hypothetical protein